MNFMDGLVVVQDALKCHGSYRDHWPIEVKKLTFFMARDDIKF
jgi:hypothetical protein